MKTLDHLSLRKIFAHVQQKLEADLALGSAHWNGSAVGASSERQWIDLFHQYLPERYKATSAFIIDAYGNRSRQIDLAVYDRFYSPVWFSDQGQPLLPAESVYAIFEVKQCAGPDEIKNAGEKTASVRLLRRTCTPMGGAGSFYPGKHPEPILGGLLTLDARWKETMPDRAPLALLSSELKDTERLDLGCFLRRGAFEIKDTHIECSAPADSLMFFILRLLRRLQIMGAAPAIDYDIYGRLL